MIKGKTRNGITSEPNAKSENKLKHKKPDSGNNPSAELARELSAHEHEIIILNKEFLSTQAKMNSLLKEYEELFELSPVGYYILDKNGLIENVNEMGSTQLGIDKVRLIGKPFITLLNCKPCQDKFIRHLHQAKETEKLQRMEGEIKRTDDKCFTVVIKSTMVKDEKLEFKHYLTLVSDITQQREHDRQLELALKKANELSDLKSRFISMASHEFRTPLSAVLSSTVLVEQYAANGQGEKMNKHLMRIKSSVKDLTTILEDFLSLEKLESGNIDIVRRNFILPEFIKEILEQVGPDLKYGQFINYEHDGEKEITEDQKILQHVLLNLLSNACKYSNENKEIKLYTKVSDGKVHIKVKDNGIGIPEEEQSNVFSRFFRAQNVENIKGTGLGLNIVKKYVELLNGTINFISKSYIGTTFIVEFPKK